MSRLFLIIIIPLAMLFVSCSEDEPVEPSDLGYDYFPDHMGRFVVYDCDSIVHQDIGNAIDTFKFYIKEKIDSFFTDNQGRPAIRITRYKKLFKADSVTYTNPQWVIQDIWWANKTSTTAEVVEENVRYVKLVFKVSEGKVWNGNAQNTLGEQDYEYTSVDVPHTIGALNFPQSLTVLQYSSGSIPIYYKKYQERYARGVGMIEKEITDYTWEVSGTGSPIIGQIKLGLSYKMKAIQYGTE